MYTAAFIDHEQGGSSIARSEAFHTFARVLSAALLADQRRCSISDAMGSIHEVVSEKTARSISRRQFLIGSGAAGAMLALSPIMGFPLKQAEAAPRSSPLSVGIK